MIGFPSPRISRLPTGYGLLSLNTGMSTVEFVDGLKLPLKIAKFDQVEWSLLENSATTLTLSSTIFALSRLNSTILGLSR